MALVVIALAWLASMAAVATWQAPWWLAGACVAAASPLWLLRPKPVSKALIVAVAIAAIVGGDVVLEGNITSEPGPGETTTSYDVDVARAGVGTATDMIEGKVRV